MKKNGSKKYIPNKKNEDVLKGKENKEDLKNEEAVKNQKEQEEQSEEKKAIKYVKKSDENVKKRVIKLVIKILIAVSVIFIVWRVFSFFNRFQHTEIDRTDIGINEELFKGELEKVVNVALLGVDSNNVADTLMVVSINPKEDDPKIKIISIARDSLVEVYPKNQGSYYTKINESYGNGGEETTLRTLNKNFNMNIRNFVSIEMEGLAVILQKLGGVDISITQDEQQQINGILKTTPSLDKLSKKEYVTNFGEVHLNGAQAVAFVRIRKKPTKDGQSDDFGRCARQREVMIKCFEKIKSIPKGKMLSLVEPCLKYLKTSFKIGEILKICRDVMGRQYKIETAAVPFEAYLPPNMINRDYKIYRDGNVKSTVYYDVKYAGKVLYKYIYEDVLPKEFIENNPPKKLNYSNLPVAKPPANFNKTKNSDKEGANQKSGSISAKDYKDYGFDGLFNSYDLDYDKDKFKKSKQSLNQKGTKKENVDDKQYVKSNKKYDEELLKNKKQNIYYNGYAKQNNNQYNGYVKQNNNQQDKFKKQETNKQNKTLTDKEVKNKEVKNFNYNKDYKKDVVNKAQNNKTQNQNIGSNQQSDWAKKQKVGNKVSFQKTR